MAYGSSALSDQCSFEPFWWSAAPLEAREAIEELPSSADVAIVGAGITGLVAALHLARGGRKVVVLDAGPPGHGASTRNAGYVGRTLKHGFGELIDAHGLDFARAIYGELMEAFRAVKATVSEEKIECHYRQQGRFLMATSPAMYEAMTREFSLRERHLGEPFSAVSRAEQAREIATRHYFGGVRIDDHAGLHPGLYHRGLLMAARKVGATVIGHASVHRIAGEAGAFQVVTRRGRISARDAIFATNGYGDGAWPWLRRRVMPFDAYQTVSAPLGEARVRDLMPADRTYIDWNFNVDWMRRVPGEPTRIVFGGLTGSRDQDLPIMAERLRLRLFRIFPDLGDLRFDAIWTGKCGGTFDLYPHIGRHDGIHFAVGYCFAGVPMGTLFGIKLARRILGASGGESAFERPLPTMPFYWGNPWFVPAAIRWMGRHDR
ncbi:MAG: FAD-binding oxidoreductase [Alphaproteobacteria bacterium]|nr:FAD-binding oxidoreductase [Alphaproteobacteria bacterium]